MSRTSRGETETRPVSTRLILDAEHSSRSATSSHVSLADSRSRRSSSASRRRRTVGLWALATDPPPRSAQPVTVQCDGVRPPRPVRGHSLQGVTILRWRANSHMHVASVVWHGHAGYAITNGVSLTTRSDQMTVETQDSREGTDSWHAYLSRLENLAGELASLGLRTRMVIPPGRLPSLHVVNPAATALAEDVYAGIGQDGQWW